MDTNWYEPSQVDTLAPPIEAGAGAMFGTGRGKVCDVAVVVEVSTASLNLSAKDLNEGSAFAPSIFIDYSAGAAGASSVRARSF